MAITLVGAGTYSTGTGGASITPVAPSFLTGDCLILSSSQFFGTDTLTDPAGWTPLYDLTNAPQMYAWGRIATSSSDTIPTIAWGGTAVSWGVVDVFRGVDTSLTQAIAGTRGRNSSTTGDIVGPASSKTPTQDNCLVYFVGSHNKTATSNGRTYSAPSGFSMLGSQAQNGATATSSGRCYQVQGTATLIAANQVMSASIADTSSGFRGLFIGLPAAASGGGGGGGTGTITFPPPKRKTYVFINNYYPR